MSWRALLGAGEAVDAIWLGGRALAAGSRRFRLAGPLPPEHGVHRFTVGGGRTASWIGPSAVAAEELLDPERVSGFLVGDRLVPDRAAVGADVLAWIGQTEPVHLVEPGLDRFARITAGRAPIGAWVFVRLELPLGPEDAVRAAYVDRASSVDRVPGVPPALDLAFRFAHRQRALVEERRARLVAEAELRAILRGADDGPARRRIAALDFAEGARRALAVGGAELLDARAAYHRGEHVVQFRFRGRRFECVCDDALRIVDAGICLRDYASGTSGDDRFTLESLPSVIREALDDGVLVVFRHLDD